MKIDYDEKKLIKLIKIVPIVIVVLFSIALTYVILHNNIEKHKENIKNIKESFVNEQKDIVKKEVLRTVREIKYQKDLSEKNLKANLTLQVNMAYEIIMNIYEHNKNKPKSEIIKLIKDALGPIRFNHERGYYFIYTTNGQNILLPTSPKLEGTNMWDLQDTKGLYTIRELSKIATTKGEGFLDWYWYKPQNTIEMYQKIGFVKYIQPLGIFVGTGEYVKDAENEVKQELINEIQEIRYGNNGYIFVHQFDGLCLAHIKKEYVGKYRLNVKDDKGNFIIKDIVDFAKKGEGFLEYTGTVMPTTGLPAKKISYIYGLKDWGWQIGAGAYISDIDSVLMQKEAEFRKELNKNIYIIIFASVVITLILIFIMLQFASNIEKGFNEYKESLSKESEENARKDKLLSEQTKLASMGEMIGNIAHQWRQPLSVISTGATGMQVQQMYGSLNDSFISETCEKINQNAQYLSKTIDDFKNFIQGNRKKNVFNLTNNINSFLSLIDGSAREHNIKIIFDLQDDITINGYDNELVQCYINIFNNARDELKEISEDQRLFFISTTIENNAIVIKFKDSAGGIPVNILPKIFEPYFTTKHKKQGTGLGLHMTYNLIVDGMGGTIEAYNRTYLYDKKEYIGAEFIITLPVSQDILA